MKRLLGALACPAFVNRLHTQLQRYRGRIRRSIAVFVFVYMLAASPVVSDPSMSVRVLPGYYFPINDPIFRPGLGAVAVIDYTPFPFFTFFAQGEYVQIGLESLDPFTLTDGSVGAGLLWRVNDRLGFRTDLMTGLYQSERNDAAISGISSGARAVANYHFSPAVTAEAYTSYRHYAYTPETFMNSVSVGVGLSVNLSEAFRAEPQIVVRTEHQEPVFPVLYSWYDDNSFATVTVTNEEPNTITDVRVSFFLERYMGQPKLSTTIQRLRPGQSVDVPITAFFNESMLELSETVNTQAQVIVEYRRLGSRRTAVLPVEMPVFHRNAMTWTDDRRAAAFVSSRDPAALWFSKYVSSIVSDRFRHGINRNLQYAMGLFDALAAYGINYVPRPTSPFSDGPFDAASIDNLQYPYETLRYRGGECDDLSILISSMLEAIGIETAFITIPGHLFMAFSAGMTEAEARESFFAPELLIYHEGQAWVPLEGTLIREDFNTAWRVGAKQWNDGWARNEVGFFPTHDSWAVYSPVSVPGAAARFNLPEEARTAQAFDATLSAHITREIRPQIVRYQQRIAENGTPAARNELGVLYGRYGMLEQAKPELIHAAQDDSIDAWINLGNIFFLEQDYEVALSYYSYVLSLEPNNSLALLGAARSYYELNDFARSDAHYSSLTQQDPELARQYGYLGSFYVTTGRAWSLSDRLLTSTWSISPEPAPAPAPIVAAATPAPTPAPEPAPQVAEPEPEPVPRPIAEPEPEPAPEPEPEIEPEPELAAVPEPEPAPPDPAPEAEPEPEPEEQPQLAAVSEPEPAPEPVPAPTAEPAPIPTPSPAPQTGGLSSMLAVPGRSSRADVAQVPESVSTEAPAQRPVLRPELPRARAGV